MSAAGTWTLALQTPIGDRKATVTFQLAGSTLSGRMTAEEGNATDIYEGHMGGKTASWKANIKNPMPLALEFSATVEGDSMTGTVSTALGSWPFSGSRSA